MGCYIFVDNMKKESRLCFYPMIIFFSFSILCPIGVKLVPQSDGFSSGDLIAIVISYLLIACFFLYCYLYAIKYQVTVTQESVFLKTLFGSKRIYLSEIESYTCKRYRKSEFYQYNITYRGKRILINIRHYNEFDKILQSRPPHNAN